MWTGSGGLSFQRDNQGSCSVKLGHQQIQGGLRSARSSELVTAVGLGAKRLLKLLQSPADPQCWRMHSSSVRERMYSLSYPCANSLLWGPNTLIFCRFTEFRCMSLPVTFGDMFLHWWESHSPIPHFLAHSNKWGNCCGFFIYPWGSPQTQWSNQRLMGSKGSKGSSMEQRAQHYNKRCLTHARICICLFML